MPQLVFADFAPQLVWLAITFTVLYLVMARVTLPRIATTLEMRRDVIANDLDEASRVKRQAEDALKAYETALADARSKALAIAADTRQKLNAEADREKAALQQVLAGRSAAAEAEIAAAKAAAMANVRQVAAETAAAIVTKLLGITPEPAALNAAINTALADRKD